MRKFETRADYYACILEAAERILAKDPFDTLHDEVSANISGGHMGWDQGANSLYVTPKDLDEALLALLLRSVLETAVENQLRAVRVLERSGDISWGFFGFPLHFSLLLDSVPKLAKRNVQLAMQVKLEMAAIAMRTKDYSLPFFIGQLCCDDQEAGDYYCGLC